MFPTPNHNFQKRFPLKTSPKLQFSEALSIKNIPKTTIGKYQKSGKQKLPKRTQHELPLKEPTSSFRIVGVLGQFLLFGVPFSF